MSNALAKLPDEGNIYSCLPERYQKNWKSGLKFDAFYGAIGNFTIVIIEKGKERFVGIAKRNPDDRENPSVGLCIAATRAYKALIGIDEEDAGYCRQRPVSKREARINAAMALIENAAKAKYVE